MNDAHGMYQDGGNPCLLMMLLHARKDCFQCWFIVCIRLRCVIHLAPSDTYDDSTHSMYDDVGAFGVLGELLEVLEGSN